MRGKPERQLSMVALSPEDLVPAAHPIRRIRKVVDAVVAELDDEFAATYSSVGRPSVPPETLLKATGLMAMYSMRSERGAQRSTGAPRGTPATTSANESGNGSKNPSAGPRPSPVAASSATSAGNATGPGSSASAPSTTSSASSPSTPQTPERPDRRRRRSKTTPKGATSSAIRRCHFVTATPDGCDPEPMSPGTTPVVTNRRSSAPC